MTITQLLTYVLNMVNNTASKGIYSLANTIDRYAAYTQLQSRGTHENRYYVLCYVKLQTLTLNSKRL